MRNRIGLAFDGWEEYMEKLDRAGGSSAMKSGVNRALLKSKEYVTSEMEKAVQPSSLPAGGKYSTRNVKDSIDRDTAVEWEGMTGSVKVGFDFSKSGPVSIFLMYGTPRTKPAKGLKAAVYGPGTKKKIAEIQEEQLQKELQKLMEG